MQASELQKISRNMIIKRIGPIFTEDQKKNGILASVSLAQFILESGCGKSELAVQANNCFGMKARISNNDWPNTAWDGNSIYTKETVEFCGDKRVIETWSFRKYSCIEDSISDHSAYLIGAKNGDRLRYEGIQGCMDYKEAVDIIYKGGYASGPRYANSLCRLIRLYDLTRFDASDTGTWSLQI